MLNAPPLTPSDIKALIAEARKPGELPSLTGETASPSIAELVDVIGEAATVQLCEAFGGVNREIGAPADLIVKAIGTDAATKLRDYWGRGRIYIPRRPLSIKARHSAVRRLASEGFTRQEIAIRMRLSERQVYNILAAEKSKRRLVNA